MALKLLDPENLCAMKFHSRDAIILSVHLVGMIAAIMLGAMATADWEAMPVKLACAFGVATLTLGYLFIGKRFGSNMDEFTKSTMVQAVLQGLIWTVLYTIFMSLWHGIKPAPHTAIMTNALVFSMPWAGGMFGYGIARLHFIKLNK